jgi:hypothetical protein
MKTQTNEKETIKDLRTECFIFCCNKGLYNLTKKELKELLIKLKR